MKYLFNNETVFLSAFPFSCKGTFPDISAHIIFVLVNDTAIYFEISDYKVELEEKRIEDSLVSDFTKVFRPFLERQYVITEKVKDTIEAKKVADSFWNTSHIVFNIKLQEKTPLNNLKKPLDLILTNYLKTLRNCIKLYYKKEMCDLSSFELKLFSKNLFLLFEIH